MPELLFWQSLLMTIAGVVVFLLLVAVITRAAGQRRIK